MSQLNTKKRVSRINSNTSARKFWGASTANYSTQNNNSNTNKILEEDIPDAEWDVPPGKIRIIVKIIQNYRKIL